MQLGTDTTTEAFGGAGATESNPFAPEGTFPAPRDEAPLRPRRGRAVFYHGAMLAGAVAVLALCFAMQVQGESKVVVQGIREPLPELCHVRRFFGINCPGCGLTRCFLSLARGDLAAAWRFNAAGYLWFAALLFQLPYRSIQVWRASCGRDTQFPSRLSTWAILVLVAALFIQWGAQLLFA
jgi:hypothetical protein